jgi:hypothetical protein
MKPITDASRVDQYFMLVDEMLLDKGTYQRNFDPAWLRHRGWKVVPVENEISHFSPEEIERIVPALNQSGYSECLAVATEPLDPRPGCYQVTVSEDDFRNFNKECGLLAYLLMDDARSWAISCYGTYKLFAGPTETLKTLLGIPISVARADFQKFAEDLDQGDVNSPFQKMALRYAKG